MSDLIRRQDVLKICDKYNGQGWVWSMIRKEVEELPCDGCCTAHSGYEADAISRQAVLDRIRESIETYHNQYTTDMLNMWGLFTQFIKEMPPVNPQPKTGHWTHDGSHWKNRFICSECGYKLFDEPTNYCPNCGCRMVEPQERKK